MNLINNVMNKHHCPTQDKDMSPKRKEDNKKALSLQQQNKRVENLS